MNQAIDFLMNIVNNKNLSEYPFKYCLAGSDKIPYTINGKLAHPNIKEDFVDLKELVNCDSLDRYAGIGISIQASNISAIDVDKCFEKEFDIETADNRAKDILNMFKDFAYIEFSFSGKGLRILFSIPQIKDYSDKYYIKNTKTGCEYYQPSNSARYVTLTGKTLYDNPLTKMKDNLLVIEFLNKYMLKPKKLIQSTIEDKIVEEKSLDELLKIVRKHYAKSPFFQELWFNKEHYIVNGLSQESETDFQLLKYLYEHITQDKEKLKLVFEQSPYFKTKDDKHLKKWLYGNYRYYEYMYKHL